MTIGETNFNSAHVAQQFGVIYQIYPRSFKDTTGTGVGDLAGVIDKLDYLGDTLGVDTIWLSPFYPSPMADFGYDVADYCDVDPLFGDLTTFDRLVTEAHLRNLKIMIDIVPNHTSDQHPWFVESRSSWDNPKRDWYVWADARPDGSPPNNWLSVFGGSAWEWDAATGQYFLHSFLKEQPDLNWRNPRVKEAMFDVYRFWLDRGVDGFRIDVAHFIMKDPQMRDNPLNPDPAAAADVFKELGRYNRYLHIHDKGHPDVHQVYRELRRILDDYSIQAPRLMVGEVHIFELETWAAYYGDNLDEMHLPFNFGLIGTPWDAQRVRRWVDAIDEVVPDGAWPNYVLGNHDEHRIASRYGRQAARVAAMLLLTLRGTPTMYYGDEIGMTDVPVPPALEQDPWGKRVPGIGLGRDPERTPMQWTAGPHAGFSSEMVDATWLPIGSDYATTNVANMVHDPRSILTLYRRLLALRKMSPALGSGRYRPLDGVPEDVYVYWREDEGQSLLVLLNFTGEERTLDLAPLGKARVLLSTELDRMEVVDLDHVTLRGHEGLIVEP